MCSWRHQLERSDFVGLIGSTVFNKLEWTLHSPEDWGLRYSACLALEGIGNANSIELLTEAKAKETDPVLSARLDKAILKSKNETSIHQIENKKIL